MNPPRGAGNGTELASSVVFTQRGLGCWEHGEVDCGFLQQLGVGWGRQEAELE